MVTADMVGQAELRLLLLMAAQVVPGPMNKQTVSSVGASCHSAAQTMRRPPRSHKTE